MQKTYWINSLPAATRHFLVNSTGARQDTHSKNKRTTTKKPTNFRRLLYAIPNTCVRTNMLHSWFLCLFHAQIDNAANERSGNAGQVPERHSPVVPVSNRYAVAAVGISHPETASGIVNIRRSVTAIVRRHIEWDINMRRRDRCAVRRCHS